MIRLLLSKHKFLGWQNGWGTRIDVIDGIKTAVYDDSVPSEYSRCLKLNHQHASRQMTRSGSENIVWCNQCRIYWKYDCS